MTWPYQLLLFEELGNRPGVLERLDFLYNKDPEAYDEAYRQSEFHEHPFFQLYSLERARDMRRLVGMICHNGDTVYRGVLEQIIHFGYSDISYHLALFGAKENVLIQDNYKAFAETPGKDNGEPGGNGNAEVVAAYIWHLYEKEDKIKKYFGKKLEIKRKELASRIREMKKSRKDRQGIMAYPAARELYLALEENAKMGKATTSLHLLKAVAEGKKPLYPENATLLMESLHAVGVNAEQLDVPLELEAVAAYLQAFAEKATTKDMAAQAKESHLLFGLALLALK